MQNHRPNFTIIASGGCNAKCSFCTDPKNERPSPNYVPNLMKAINDLPNNFDQVSITGGEPTISPHLIEILTLVKFSGKFKKVVFTTNGTNLLKYKETIAQCVDHINISRHAIGYEDNVKIFKNRQIIKDDEILQASRYFGKYGIDINLNHVYVADSDLTEGYVQNYVQYAKSVGAGSVSFRYDQDENSLEPTYLEERMSEYKNIHEGGCPVCRHHTNLVDGLPVVFKASFSEPSHTVDYLYELIYHPNGKLTEDWAGETEYNVPKEEFPTFIPHVRTMDDYINEYRGGGCGSVGGGCGTYEPRGGGCGSYSGGGC